MGFQRKRSRRVVVLDLPRSSICLKIWGRRNRLERILLQVKHFRPAHSLHQMLSSKRPSFRPHRRVLARSQNMQDLKALDLLLWILSTISAGPINRRILRRMLNSTTTMASLIPFRKWRSIPVRTKSRPFITTITISLSLSHTQILEGSQCTTRNYFVTTGKSNWLSSNYISWTKYVLYYPFNNLWEVWKDF